jgi:hypothetical protein
MDSIRSISETSWESKPRPESTHLRRNVVEMYFYIISICLILVIIIYRIKKCPGAKTTERRWPFAGNQEKGCCAENEMRRSVSWKSNLEKLRLKFLRQPTVKVAYPYRTVRDFLEIEENWQEIPKRTNGGANREAFKASRWTLQFSSRC